MAASMLSPLRCGAFNLVGGAASIGNGEASTSCGGQPSCTPLFASHRIRQNSASTGSRTARQSQQLGAKFGREMAGRRNGVCRSSAPASSSSAVSEEGREDDVLPDSLHGAVMQSAEAAARLFDAGGERALVELLFPELESMANEGDQQRLWDLCKEFVQAFQEQSGIEKVRVVFADAGAAAMLKYKWADVTFEISSLNDRQPVKEEDEAAILVSPDHTALPSVQKVVDVFDKDEIIRPLIMWNPRLVSGDVGVGLNVRRLREGMLGTFTVAYSLRSLPNGSVYRSFPEPWKVFFSDPKVAGRYTLAGVSDTRPDPDEIERLAMGESARDSGREAPSTVEKAAGVFNSLQRFMKSLSS